MLVDPYNELKKQLLKRKYGSEIADESVRLFARLIARDHKPSGYKAACVYTADQLVNTYVQAIESNFKSIVKRQLRGMHDHS